MVLFLSLTDLMYDKLVLKVSIIGILSDDAIIFVRVYYLESLFLLLIINLLFL